MFSSRLREGIRRSRLCVGNRYCQYHGQAASVASFRPNCTLPSVFSVLSVPLWLKLKAIGSDSPGIVDSGLGTGLQM